MKNNEPDNIPNDTLKWLKNSRFYGSLDKIFDVSLSKLQPRKEAQMGKSLNGKELGKGISQRKDGLYQARFVNRFGKRETIYAKTLNEIRHQLRTEQYEDEKMLNVISKEMTLDEWYEIWMNTCKKNCRSSTKSYWEMGEWSVSNPRSSPRVSAPRRCGISTKSSPLP